MQQAQAMQKKMEEMQQKLAETEITGKSGGGMVQITMNGKGEAKKLIIDPKLVDPSDKEVLEDLIVAAINDAKNQNESKMSDEMGKLTGGLGLPAGFKLPF
jgi:DNA-binding YbaB/EbfC family protein